jgi:hypothetical protein
MQSDMGIREQALVRQLLSNSIRSVLLKIDSDCQIDMAGQKLITHREKDWLRICGI